MKKLQLLSCLCLLTVPLLFACSNSDNSTAPEIYEERADYDRATSEGSYSEPKASADEGTSASDKQSVAQQVTIEPRSGLLTAGEWNDNEHFDFLIDLMDSHQEWDTFSSQWEIVLRPRIAIEVKRGSEPFANVKVELLDSLGKPLWSTCSDNQGKAWLFKDLARNGQLPDPAIVRVSTADLVLEQTVNGQEVLTFDFPAGEHQEKALDLMMVIDTTGSMGDELEFLKKELESVINQVKEDNGNLPLRLSVNVYRDIGDDYVVRPMPFTTDIKSQTDFLAKQSAAGGGDYEEAVELALHDAIYNHDWNPDATAKLLFLVLDAPPHNTTEIRKEMKSLAQAAAAAGIRIIPIASSGVDKNTEFLMRSLAVATGGTYIFLTDHSGIGEAHLEPTIGNYDVELLNDLMIRIINSYLK